LTERGAGKNPRVLPRTTLAGNGTAGYSGDTGAATMAELYYPYGAAVDGMGNVYIADTNTHPIR
jgi:hypothetical protein